MYVANWVLELKPSVELRLKRMAERTSERDEQLIPCKLDRWNELTREHCMGKPKDDTDEKTADAEQTAEESTAGETAGKKEGLREIDYKNDVPKGDSIKSEEHKREEHKAMVSKQNDCTNVAVNHETQRATHTCLHPSVTLPPSSSMAGQRWRSSQKITATTTITSTATTVDERCGCGCNVKEGVATIMRRRNISVTAMRECEHGILRQMRMVFNIKTT